MDRPDSATRSAFTEEQEREIERLAEAILDVVRGVPMHLGLIALGAVFGRCLESAPTAAAKQEAFDHFIVSARVNAGLPIEPRLNNPDNVH